MADVFDNGFLLRKQLSGLAEVTSDVLVCREGARGVVVHTHCDQAGTLVFERKNTAGEWRALTSSLAVSANVARNDNFQFPVGRLRAKFTPAASPATVEIDGLSY